MSTAAQFAANQANSRLSTGPVTEEGKTSSSRNNTRHGFRSRSVILPGDDPAEYEALLTELTEHFSPQDLTETRFVREMTDADWRLRRLRSLPSRTPVPRHRDARRNRNLLRNLAPLRNQIRASIRPCLQRLDPLPGTSPQCRHQRNRPRDKEDPLRAAP
jgi:hypothetical protein